MVQPMRNLFSIAVSVSAFTAFANTLWMLSESGGGRIRDVGLLRLIRLLGILFDLDPTRPLPALFHRYQDLTSWSIHPAFLATGFAVNVAVGVGVAFLAVPLLAPRARRMEQLADKGTNWEVLLCVAVGLVCLTPALTLPSQWLTRIALELAHWRLVAVVISGTVLAGCGLASFRLLRSPTAPVRLRESLVRTAYFFAALLIAGVVGLGLEPAKPPAAAGVPNILLISIDSLRRDHVSAYGYQRPTTPRIDALAREGVLFDMAIAPTSWTLPSHVSLLTSLPARLHGVRDIRQRFGRDVVTLAEVLSEAGYATAGFIAGSFLSATHGFSQGFDVYDDYTILERDRGEDGGHITSPRSIAAVRRWLDGRGRQEERRPFFVFLHMWDVHYEYLPPPPYDKMFDPDYEGDIGEYGLLRDSRINKNMPARDLEHIEALYDGEIRYTDEHLGQLFDLLRQRGLFDDTITVVTSDHGDEFFEHGGKGHAETLYDEVLRVPLVMRYPKGIPAGRVVDRQVRLMDVAPTLLEMAGVYRPDNFGYCGDRPRACRSLVPWIQGASDLPSLISYGHLKRRLQSVRTDTAKMIRGTGDRGRAMRFDVVSDTEERVNLFGGDEGRVDTLFSGLLDQWWKNAETDQAEPADIDASQIEVLRSLGYLK